MKALLFIVIIRIIFMISCSAQLFDFNFTFISFINLNHMKLMIIIILNSSEHSIFHFIYFYILIISRLHLLVLSLLSNWLEDSNLKQFAKMLNWYHKKDLYDQFCYAFFGYSQINLTTDKPMAFNWIFCFVIHFQWYKV